MSAFLRLCTMTVLSAGLILASVPAALAAPVQPEESVTAARSTDGQAARSLYVDDVMGGVPGLTGDGSSDLSRRQTLVEAARASGLADAGNQQRFSSRQQSDLSGLEAEIARQDELHAEREERASQEAAARAEREAAEREAAQREAEEAANAKAAVAVKTALAQIGKPYRWGGNGPSSFDCSGLTSYAWRAAGVTLPRVSRDQYRATKRVSRDELQPGDLLFFYSPISHVGLYIGDGKMVDAPYSGKDVRVRSIFRGNFVGAGRPQY